MHTVGGLAYELIRQLPADNRVYIMSEGNGLFCFSDINWTDFHRDGKPGMSILFDLYLTFI